MALGGRGREKGPRDGCAAVSHNDGLRQGSGRELDGLAGSDHEGREGDIGGLGCLFRGRVKAFQGRDSYLYRLFMWRGSWDCATMRESYSAPGMLA